MVLRNTTSLTINSDSDFTPSLPDPATVAGRTHDLVNTGAAIATWTSIGVLPFHVDGIGVPSLVVARGARVQVQSDGVRWVVISPGGSVGKSVRLTAVTDAAGNATFSLAGAGFGSAPVVTTTVQTPSTGSIDVKVTALTAASCTVNVRQAPIVTVVAVSVLGAPAPLVGATVHLHAFVSGSTA
jgi:hypothetical protein